MTTKREIDLDLLAYLCKKGERHIEAAVRGSEFHPKTVIGVGTFLLDRDGNVDLMTPKQLVTYQRFLEPLLFDVRCRSGAACRGDGTVEAALLGKGYRDDDLRCRNCRAAS